MLVYGHNNPIYHMENSIFVRYQAYHSDYRVEYMGIKMSPVVSYVYVKYEEAEIHRPTIMQDSRKTLHFVSYSRSSYFAFL